MCLKISVFILLTSASTFKTQFFLLTVLCSLVMGVSSSGNITVCLCLGSFNVLPPSHCSSFPCLLLSLLSFPPCYLFSFSSSHQNIIGHNIEPKFIYFSYLQMSFIFLVVYFESQHREYFLFFFILGEKKCLQKPAKLFLSIFDRSWIIVPRVYWIH